MVRYCDGAIKPALIVLMRCLLSRICWLLNRTLRTPDAVMITGDTGFQRVQALQVHLVACA